MEHQVPFTEKRLSSNANRKFNGEERKMTMRATTMNETTNDSIRELSADDMTGVAGGDLGVGAVIAISIATSFVASALYDGYKSYNGPHLGPF
jgi:hypothetical protein